MFDIAMQFMTQLIDLIPAIIGVYLIFDLTGSLLFGRS